MSYVYRPYRKPGIFANAGAMLGLLALGVVANGAFFGLIVLAIHVGAH